MTKQADHASREHARWSPSKLHALAVCPRFVEDKNAKPHPMTLRGQAMHEALETGSDKGLTPEEVALVKLCRDYVARWAGWERRDEIKLQTPGDQFGYADLVFLNADRTEAALIDYKTGFNKQLSVEENPATQAYVDGIFARYPSVRKIEVHYIYPRLGIVDTCTYTREDLPRIHLRCEMIVERARTAQEGDENYNSDNCIYCGRRGSCPLLWRTTMPVLALRDPESILPAAVEHTSYLTDPELAGRAMNAVPILEKLAEDIRFNVNKLRREFGVEIPGYVWTHRKGDTSVLNPLAVVAKAREFGLDDADIMSACEVSVSKITEKIMEHAKRGEKAKLAQQFRDELEDSGVVEQKPETWFLKKEKKK